LVDGYGAGLQPLTGKSKSKNNGKCKSRFPAGMTKKSRKKQEQEQGQEQIHPLRCGITSKEVAAKMSPPAEIS